MSNHKTCSNLRAMEQNAASRRKPGENEAINLLVTEKAINQEKCSSALEKLSHPTNIFWNMTLHQKQIQKQVSMQGVQINGNITTETSRARSCAKPVENEDPICTINERVFTSDEKDLRQKFPDQKSVLWNLHLERKALLQTMDYDLEDLVMKCLGLKRELNALEDSNRELKKEARSIRAKYEAMLEKNKRDSNIILALQNSEQKLKQAVKEKLHLGHVMDNSHQRKMQLCVENRRLENERNRLVRRSQADNNRIVKILALLPTDIGKADKVEEDEGKQIPRRKSDEQISDISSTTKDEDGSEKASADEEIKLKWELNRTVFDAVQKENDFLSRIYSIFNTRMYELTEGVMKMKELVQQEKAKKEKYLIKKKELENLLPQKRKSYKIPPRDPIEKCKIRISIQKETNEQLKILLLKFSHRNSEDFQLYKEFGEQIKNIYITTLQRHSSSKEMLQQEEVKSSQNNETGGISA
ncbi:desmoplakin-like isoform X4 [Stegodyphus dumicola]|uniref:desmoplakin-like isoform X4 n=1 Tax=Stegodyphus dumicola TaxID=202533 RepID=UPI0015B32A94|nr:desmoplakin-like isoform X4 [Stegodyphus dumicola]